MPEPFRILTDRAALLGNHHHKYLRAIETHLERLVRLLESHRVLDRVHLWSPSSDQAQEMDLIRRLGDRTGDAEDLLGCYYALHFLQMNLALIDRLRLSMLARADRSGSYKDFMIRSGLAFRSLTANYMATLLDLFLAPAHRPDFSVCGVGSRSDQDDIDIAVIDDGSAQREDLNRAVAKLGNEMLRSASYLHFYLSEHMTPIRLSGTVAEYRELLDRERQDFVLTNEVIGAALILGSDRLFEQFRSEVTRRYHFLHGQDNRFHEIFLRGILGEVRSLLVRENRPGVLQLKDGGLRMLKAMIYVEKSRFGIERVNPWDILAELQASNPGQHKVYRAVEESLNFLEVFRHLYQLFVVQEEEVAVDQVGIGGDSVAEYMGYPGNWEQLIFQHHEHVRKAKVSAEALLESAARHLRSSGTLSDFLGRPAGVTPRRNLVLEFARAVGFYAGTKFWDDLLVGLEEDDGKVLTRFGDAYSTLPPAARKRVAAWYADLGHHSFYALMSLIVILAENQRRCCCQAAFDDLNDAFLRLAPAVEGRVPKTAKLFEHYPHLVHRYLSVLDPDRLQRFQEVMVDDTRSAEDSPSRGRLKRLLQLHCETSPYFRRHFTRAGRSTPECLSFLGDRTKLARIAEGLLAQADDRASGQEKARILGNYYDVEFLRVGLGTLDGASVAATSAEFTCFCDTYLTRLFDACRHHVEATTRDAPPTADALAIFTAGGRAREQAYEDDCDLIILLDSIDQPLHDHCDRIARLVNSELQKVGMHPHYHFAEHFGRYVTTLAELEDLVAAEHPNDFIDKAQLLGSRCVIGSRLFRSKFERDILRRHIFGAPGNFGLKMLQEMQARHQQPTPDEGTFDLKEGRGGLRDIEMILLVQAARHGIPGPANEALIRILAGLEPKHAAHLDGLRHGLLFMSGLRDTYKLAVSAEYLIQSCYLTQPARILGFAGAAELWAALMECSSSVTRSIEALAAAQARDSL
jgi:hypothetical protein